jgi:Tfp pilus assembly protein PilV
LTADKGERNRVALSCDACRSDLGHADAFTLLEVMIALAIFFMAVFVILQSTSQSLGAARGLQMRAPDAISLIAELSLTNKLEEGIMDGDFGDLYPGATWTRETYQVATNGLFQVDFTLHWSNGKRPVESRSSILMWRPDSQVSPFGGFRK